MFMPRKNFDLFNPFHFYPEGAAFVGAASKTVVALWVGCYQFFGDEEAEAGAVGVHGVGVFASLEFGE